MTPQRSPLPIKYVSLLFITIILWGMGPPLVKYFTEYYDVWTQNAYRYLFATLFLFAIIPFQKKPVFRLTPQQWRLILLIAIPNNAMQTLFALAYYYIFPSVAGLVERLNVIWVCLFSAILFHDERKVLRSGLFMIAVCLTVSGVITVVLGQNAKALASLNVSRAAYWTGLSITLSQTIVWALYGIGIKRSVGKVEPFAAFTNVSWITTVGLVILMFLFGKWQGVWSRDLDVMGIIALSGVFPIAIAHTVYYAVLREIKLTVTVTMLQLVPVFTCIFSAIIYDDRLSYIQIIGAAAVLSGAWLASIAQARKPAAIKPASHG